MAAPMKFSNFYPFLLLFCLVSLYTASTKDVKRNIFSTKTPYRWVVDLDEPVAENDFMVTKHDGRHCVAIHSQTFLRHGARNPGKKDIRKMSDLHLKLKLATTKEGFEFLKSWENRFSESEEKLLVDEGEDEQYVLGRRMAKRLAKLFNEELDGVKFVSSSMPRCVHSSHAFYEGFTEQILGEAEENLVPIINDKILRFHTICKKYADSVENNRTLLKPFKDFKTHPVMLKIAENVKTRLGIQHAELDAGEIKLLFFLCTFELTNYEEDNWCHLLTEDEHRVVEYHNDLKQYWKKAYGHPICARMSCPLMKEIFSSLDKAIESALNNKRPRGSKAAFYFGHTETLAPLYAALGLFNDSQPLLNTNFEEMKSRKFQSSKILPFSANLAFVLYKCDYEHQMEPSIDDYVIRMYVNEHPVEIPACGKMVCPYSQVRERYHEHIDNCNFDTICENVHDEL